MSSGDRLPRGVEVRPVTEVDAAQATALLKHALGEGYGRQKSERLWRWKHELNPAGRSLGVAAFAGGELIALRPFMRWNLAGRGGERVAAVRAVDTAVHAAWRGRGVFSALTEAAVAELSGAGVTLVFNTPNENSAPGYRKMGWRLLGHPTLWVRPMFGRTPGGGTDAPSLGEHLDLLDTLSGCPLSAESADFGRLSVLKDRAYLEWRYGRHPNLSYRIVRVSDDAAAPAAAIVRGDRRRGRSGVAIVDTFSPDGDRASYRRLLDAAARSLAGAYAVTAPCARSSSAVSALSLGFVPIRWRAVTFAVRALTEEAQRWALSRRRWALSLGDLETF